MYATDFGASEHTDGKSRDGRKPMRFSPCSLEGREQGEEEQDNAQVP
jgi:hypothetical protein